MNIKVKTSRIKLYFFCGLLLLTMTSILSLNLHWDWQLIMLTLTMCGGIFLLKEYFVARRSEASPGYFCLDMLISISRLNKDTWEMQYQSGNNFRGVLQGNSLTTSFCSILILKSANHFFNKAILVFKDSLCDKDYHLLQLHLKGLLSD